MDSRLLRSAAVGILLRLKPDESGGPQLSELITSLLADFAASGETDLEAFASGWLSQPPGHRRPSHGSQRIGATVRAWGTASQQRDVAPRTVK
jgi:hypothetical protein